MSKLTSMAKDLLIIDEDFFMRSRGKDHQYISQEYYDLYVFDQLWPDTSCGFGGIAGQAFTERTVYAFVPKAFDLTKTVQDQPEAIIYIGFNFAYKVPKSDILLDDIKHHRIRPVYEKDIYFQSEESDNE